MTRRERDVEWAHETLRMVNDPAEVAAGSLILGFRYRGMTAEVYQEGLAKLEARAKRLLYEVKRTPPLKP